MVLLYRRLQLLEQVSDTFWIGKKEGTYALRTVSPSSALRHRGVAVAWQLSR